METLKIDDLITALQNMAAAPTCLYFTKHEKEVAMKRLWDVMRLYNNVREHLDNDLLWKRHEGFGAIETRGHLIVSPKRAVNMRLFVVDEMPNTMVKVDLTFCHRAAHNWPGHESFLVSSCIIGTYIVEFKRLREINDLCEEIDFYLRTLGDGAPDNRTNQFMLAMDRVVEFMGVSK